MPDLTAKRTLVKSPPELWSELSELERLARHLGAFGEITITKLELERTVAWEGEAASGTVSIEPSGWGTRVTLTAQLEEEEVPEPVADEAPEPVADEAPEPAAHIEPVEAEPAGMPAPKRGFFARLFRRERGAQPEPVAVQPEPSDETPEPEPITPEPEPITPEPEPITPEPEPIVPEPEPVAPEPEPVALQAEPGAEPPENGTAGLGREAAQAVLEDALDALGSAHHRPFSRG